MSVAVHVTIVSPNGKTSGASLVTEETPTISETVASPIETCVSFPAASIVMFTGVIISGGVVSTTVMTWVAFEVFPEVSDTVQVTVVIPIENEVGESFVTDPISTKSSTLG